ncbi:unnamed protein product [Alternaria alternata]
MRLYILERTQKAFDPTVSKWKVWTPLLEAELTGRESDWENLSDVSSGFDEFASNSGKGSEPEQEVSISMNLVENPIYYGSLLGLVDVVKWLADQDLDCDCTGGRFGFPKQAAVARNQDGVLRYLLDRNVDVQQEGGLYGFTIIAAATLSSLELVKLLLNSGADATVVDDMKWTALHHAAKRGAAEIVKCLLIHGAQVNSMTPEKITAANLACRLGHKDVLSISIAEGADLALVDVDGASPLQQALENGHQDLALELIDRLSFTTTTHLRWGPIQTAVRAGYSSIIKKMIDKEIDVNMLDECNRTAIQLAAALGDIDAVQTLIGAGADITLAHADTSPPLQIAAGNNHVAIIKLLAENGADVNQLDDDGTTALIVAVSNSCQDALEALLDMGASMQCMYSHGQQSLFDIAIEEGHDNITEILIARGCVRPRGLTAIAKQGVTTPIDVNQHQYLPMLSYRDDTKGLEDRLSIVTTPFPICELNEALHVASARGSKSIVQILLARGASAKTQDINGRSALH